MATTLDELKRRVSEVLQVVRPGMVIEGRAGEAAAPVRPYALFSVESVAPVDFPIVSYDELDPPTIQTVTSTATPVEFLIEAVGGAAMGDAFRMCLTLRTSQRCFDLYAICGLMGVTAPVNLSALEVGTMRQRAQFRLTVSAALDFTADAETIEHISATAFDRTVTVSKGVNPHGC